MSLLYHCMVDGTHGIYTYCLIKRTVYILNTGEFRLSAGYGRSKIYADNGNLALDARTKFRVRRACLDYMSTHFSKKNGFICR